jgi:hypothetical protein
MAATLTTLVSFNRTNDPFITLIADAAGDLLGTTYFDGANDVGTVFEIAKTPSGYASTPTMLFSFDGTNGAVPLWRPDRQRRRSGGASRSAPISARRRGLTKLPQCQ